LSFSLSFSISSNYSFYSSSYYTFCALSLSEIITKPLLISYTISCSLMSV
jgi:hypothetical protein